MPCVSRDILWMIVDLCLSGVGEDKCRVVRECHTSLADRPCTYHLSVIFTRTSQNFWWWGGICHSVIYGE